jgi:glycosyltransferase involved in cell wall biosynthesis
MFGRLSARKGLGYLVDALELDGAGIHLVLAGEPTPEFERTLSSLIARLDAAGVISEVSARFHSEAQGLEVLSRVRAAVLPYVGHVGMSRVLLEAAAVGTPVVAHLDGLVGYLVATRGLGVVADCRDPAALAAAVRKLSDDPGSAEQYGEALRRFAADHSSRRFATAVGEPFAPSRRSPPD